MPVVITVNLIKTAMEKAVATGKTTFLIDGFPRNQENLEGWNTVMGNYCKVAFTFFFNCSEQVMENRLLERGKTSGRSDDNAESIRKRYRLNVGFCACVFASYVSLYDQCCPSYASFKTYTTETSPIIALFAAKNMAREINSDRDVDIVYADARREFLAIPGVKSLPGKAWTAPSRGVFGALKAHAVPLSILAVAMVAGVFYARSRKQQKP